MIKDLLKKLHDEFPAEKGRHHNITLDLNANVLVLTIWLGESMINVNIDERDDDPIKNLWEPLKEQYKKLISLQSALSKEFFESLYVIQKKHHKNRLDDKDVMTRIQTRYPSDKNHKLVRAGSEAWLHLYFGDEEVKVQLNNEAFKEDNIKTLFQTLDISCERYTDIQEEHD